MGLPAGDLTLDHDVGERVRQRVLDRVRDLRDRVDARRLAGFDARDVGAGRHVPACASAASARFWRSIATVRGPTPPGTGVSAEATPPTDSGSTSPVYRGAPSAG